MSPRPDLGMLDRALFDCPAYLILGAGLSNLKSSRALFAHEILFGPMFECRRAL